MATQAMGSVASPSRRTQAWVGSRLVWGEGVGRRKKEERERGRRKGEAGDKSELDAL
jgi:hypothetical protein